MLHSLVLAVTFSSLVHLVSTCCLDWVWPGDPPRPTNTSATADKAVKAVECEPMAVLEYWDDVGKELLLDMVDPLRILRPPVIPTQKPAGTQGAEPAGGVTTKDVIPPAGGGSGGGGGGGGGG